MTESDGTTSKEVDSDDSAGAGDGIFPVPELQSAHDLTKALGRAFDAVDSYLQRVLGNGSVSVESQRHEVLTDEPPALAKELLTIPTLSGISHMFDPALRSAAWKLVGLLSDALSSGGREGAQKVLWIAEQMSTDKARRFDWVNCCRTAFRACRSALEEPDRAEVIAEQSVILQAALADVQPSAASLSLAEIEDALRSFCFPGLHLVGGQRRTLAGLAGRLAAKCRAFGYSDPKKAAPAFAPYEFEGESDI